MIGEVVGSVLGLWFSVRGITTNKSIFVRLLCIPAAALYGILVLFLFSAGVSHL